MESPTSIDPHTSVATMTANLIPTILTIDDEPSIRRSFRLYLEDLDYKIIEAESGHKGLELAATEQPNLVLLDLRMPDLNGLQTLEKLQRDHADIPVIVISGTGDIRDVVEALRHGAWDYITKPITNMTVLEHAISKALERAQLIKENQAYQVSLETEVKNRTSELEETCRALYTSKQTFEALFQAVPLAVILLDAKRHITLWNRGAEQLFDWPAANDGQIFCPLFEDLDVELRSAITKGGLNNQELTLNRSPNQKISVNVSTACLDDINQEASATVLVLKNITEKKRLQCEADRANRLASLGQLAAGVAHEINNPNGLILLNMPTLHETLIDALAQLDALQPKAKVGGLSLKRARDLIPQLGDEMSDAARRIRQIVEDLKDFASRDSSESAVNFDLNHSAKRALRLASNRIKQSTDCFNFELTEPLPLTHGNPQRIEQVIVNLLINACESLTDRSASLKLLTRIDTANEMVELQVIDQGVGIAPDDMKHITDPFFTTRRESGGTGLGLSVSARITREHGGRLHFDSQLGKGTCATLSLPRIQEGS